MKHLTRTISMLLIGLLISLTLTCVLAFKLSGNRAELVYLAKLLADCREIVSEIKEYSAQSVSSSPREYKHSELAQKIEQAATMAGINPVDQLSRISPRQARRVEGGPYLEKATDLSLLRITLGQLVGFFYQLQENAEHLQLTQLRLQAPHDEVLGDRWHVEATLRYLVYDPLEETDPEEGIIQ